MSLKPPKRGDNNGWMKKRQDKKIRIQPEYHLIVTEGEKTPLKVRKVPQFQDYFDILWKELDSYEIKK